MSAPVVTGDDGLQISETAPAQNASPTQPTKQSARFSGILTIVLITVVLAASVAIVAVTFLYWAPQARSWSFPRTDDFVPDGERPNPSDPSSPVPRKPRRPPHVSEQPTRSPVRESTPAARAPPQPRPFSSLAHKPSEESFFTPDDASSYVKHPKEEKTDDYLDLTDSQLSEPPGTPPLSADEFLADEFLVDTPPSPPVQNPPDDSSTDRVMTLDETPPEIYVQGYTSPHYPRLRLLLHGPSPIDPEGKTAIYEERPQRNFCAVSAGNEKLTLPEPLVSLLMSAAENTSSSLSAEDLQTYASLAHMIAAARARSQPGTVVAMTLRENPVYSRLFALRPFLSAWEAREFGALTGLVMLGIFKPPFYPYGNPANRFHLYAVPPRESSRNPFFLRAYKGTYRNCLRMVDIFNGRNGQGAIRQVRFPLLRDKPAGETDAQLAKAATGAILLYAFRKTPSFAVDLTYDEDNTFFHQMQDALSPRQPRSFGGAGSVETIRSLRS